MQQSQHPSDITAAQHELLQRMVCHAGLPPSSLEGGEEDLASPFPLRSGVFGNSPAGKGWQRSGPLGPQQVIVHGATGQEAAREAAEIAGPPAQGFDGMGELLSEEWG